MMARAVTSGGRGGDSNASSRRRRRWGWRATPWPWAAQHAPATDRAAAPRLLWEADISVDILVRNQLLAFLGV